MSGRIGGGEVGIFDSRGHQLIDGEYDAADARFAPIVGDRAREIVGFGKRCDTAQQPVVRLIRLLTCKSRSDEERTGAQRSAMGLELLTPLERGAGDLPG